MKEVIMKNIISLLVLICSVAVIIVSCAKKDDETTTATATSAAGTGSGTTASGTVSGIDNLTGTFNLSYYQQEPSGGCIDNSTAVAAFVSLSAVPSDTLAFKKQIIITSSTTYTNSVQYYSDASCATITGYVNLLYKDFLVGVSLSGLSGSSPTKPTTAKKVSYNEQSLALNCNTDTCTTFFNSLYTASALSTLGYTQGTELLVTNTGSEVNIWETGTLSGSSKAYLFTGTSAASTYPDNWTSNTSVYWQE
jgi:hypothetical protein